MNYDQYVKMRQSPCISMVLKWTFGVNEQLIICTCDDIKEVNDHQFICPIGKDEFRYKFFDHTTVWY